MKISTGTFLQGSVDDERPRASLYRFAIFESEEQPLKKPELAS